MGMITIKKKSADVEDQEKEILKKGLKLAENNS